MNQYRNTRRTHPSVFIALILAALVAAAGGVLTAYYKNRQFQTASAINQIDRRIEQYRLDIRTTQWHADQLLDRFAIRERLRDKGTNLRQIPHGVVEVMDPHNPPPRTVASALP